ncbi:MAG: HlyD family efflux transporter periplasmic adaptor subunit [Eubacteriales bacterium]|nr:HlyD family efflux transporter periplasmic adaptor subunit [Eubacteriales bacterium]
MNESPFLNIGTMMFGVLFIYMLICLIIYVTSSKITPYEVTSGTLSGNYRYTAVALKSESVVYTSESGKISYFAREGSKIGVGSGVYSVGSLSPTVQSAQEDDTAQELKAADFSSLRGTASTFANNYSAVNYQEVYNFQAEAQTAMLELLSGNTMDEAAQSSALNLVSTDQAGIVVYSVDGMEDKTIEDLKPEDFDRKNYTRTNLRQKKSVKANDPVYKLITGEEWSMVILLDRKTATELADQTVIRFRFTEEDVAFNADFSILQVDGNYYGKLDLSHSVIRYASDRFIDIELLVNRQSGLKIPKSSIAEKTFYRIPAEFVFANADSDEEIGLLTETYDTDGSAITKYMRATVYEKTDTDYYIDTSLFSPGDYVLLEDSSKRYQISDTKSLIGVFNINKGYPVFREITILDENEEYCIVESNSTYGLAQYDHIALDADSVKVSGEEE